MSSPRLGRKPRDSNSQIGSFPLSRETLLDKAAELFARRGFEGVTVRDIADLSGITMPTLYHFFGDKRGLYVEACKREFLEVAKDLILKIDRKGDPHRRLYNFTVAQCRVLLEPRPIAQLLRRELLEQDVEGIKILTELAYTPMLESVAGVILEIAPDRDAARTVMAIHALILGLTDMAPIDATAAHPSLPVGPIQTAQFVLSTIIPECVWPPQSKRGK